MYRQQSIASLRSLKLGACHFLVNIIIALVGCGFLAAGFITHVKQWIVTGSTIMVIWAVSVFLFFILSYSWRCPLCMGKLWVRTGISRHNKAVKALGVSYRLGIATSTVIGKHYHCPYCGESFSTTKAHR